ncbi:E3 binding domain-containing protein, partial [Alphaproteobacteria bacterium]|nr:E3 binding domain-containing protein [Alphaproteobacteria bacterium]
MSVNILMPALSPTMEEGTLSKWLVKEGDTVTSGDLIAEIETDKATMEVESIDDGTIGKILVHEGQESVKVNEPIAILLLDGENLSDIKSIKKVPPTEIVQEIEKIESKEKLNFSSDKTSKINLDTNINIENLKKNETRIFASPLAKRIAKQKDVDLSLVNGSGPNGRILKADIEN